MKTFICEICSTPLGQVNLDDLAVPMTPDMFHSLMPERGIPIPFQPILSWTTFRCRQCRARPFMTMNNVTILDENGFHKRIDIYKYKAVEKARLANQAIIDAAFEDEPEEPRKIIKCKHCNKVYQKKTLHFKRHEAKCNG